MSARKTKPSTVAQFIARADARHRGTLRQLRRIILSAAPQAVESVSYGMPYYAHKGRLAYFNLYKTHLGLYVPTPIIAEHKAALSAYETAKATVRFPLDGKLPSALIRKLIVARRQKNEARKSPNKKRKNL